MTTAVCSEDGGTTTATTPLVSGRGITETFGKYPRGRKDSISRYNRVVDVITRLVKLFDCLERGDEVGSEAISPFTILSKRHDLPGIAIGALEDTCVTFEIRHVLLVLEKLRQCYER